MPVDPRFQPLFLPMLTQDPTTGVYSAGWQLVEETVTGPVLEVRLRVECAVLCHGASDCTGVNFLRQDGSCRMMRFEAKDLP